jgi:hypothetical protein
MKFCSIVVMRAKEVFDQNCIPPMVNGTALVLPDRAQALAAYPHARVANGFIFVSGISSRRFDNTYEGVRVVIWQP